MASFPGARRALAILAALAAIGAAGGPAMRPGMWETTTTVTDAVVPSVPGFIVRALMRPKTARRCIAPAEGDVWQAIAGKDCVATDPRAGGNVFAVDLVCGAYRTRLAGRSSADRVEGIATTTKTGSALDVRARFVSRRTGDCLTSTGDTP